MWIRIQGSAKVVFDELRRDIIKCLALVEALIDFGEGEDIEDSVYLQGLSFPLCFLADVVNDARPLQPGH